MGELSRHLAEGRLSVAEFDDRCVLAAVAETRPQLAELFTDLPALQGRAPIPANRRYANAPLAVLALAGVIMSMATGSGFWLVIPLVVFVAAAVRHR